MEKESGQRRGSRLADRQSETGDVPGDLRTSTKQLARLTSNEPMKKWIDAVLAQKARGSLYESSTIDAPFD
ncbi:hypothetical protein [Aporhodopirellula aestuarii]|uniref:Uncharacterized protein n=1 Tax=Aporhodopirellula aestuarii TaxID=2950107 RepID=A0ABT0TYV0_9BACT|nr:hypothetical protein [Aporhodopirellula aestuarii]MCM2369779.1 hypothetical protein [Aporhodopirellula aestuarii]